MATNRPSVGEVLARFKKHWLAEGCDDMVPSTVDNVWSWFEIEGLLDLRAPEPEEDEQRQTLRTVFNNALSEDPSDETAEEWIDRLYPHLLDARIEEGWQGHDGSPIIPENNWVDPKIGMSWRRIWMLRWPREDD